MKAMLLKEYDRPLEFVDVETPKPMKDQILLKVKACGICHSDLKIYRGEIPPPLVVLPHVPGHEVAGEVAMVGEGVLDIAEGDVGVVYLYVPCRQCEWCIMGQDNLCIRLKRIGFDLQGGFAEYLLVPSYSFCRFKKGLPFHEMAILPDAVATPYHAITRLAGVKPGQDILIVGVGGLGIHGVQIAKLSGTRVIAVDKDPEALGLAEDFKADVTVKPEDDLAERIGKLTHGRGVDAVIEMVGSPETLNWSLPSLKKGGTLVLVGYVPGRPFSVDSMAMHYNEWNIIGARLSTKAELLDVIKLVERGQIQPVVTKEYPFEQANEALGALSAGATVGRIVLTFSP
jgi:2-desacetyl-2-hydroxyethyl bacteriochlorophyllide A dehydrogenase